MDKEKLNHYLLMIGLLKKCCCKFSNYSCRDGTYCIEIFQESIISYGGVSIIFKEDGSFKGFESYD